MNGFRKLVLVLFGLALAAPALAASQQKLFDVKVTSGASTKLTYDNLSKGNSNINSMWFQSSVGVSNVTLQPSLITGTTTISPPCATNGSVCDPNTKISIANINGIVPGSSGYVTMTTSVPISAQSCNTSIDFSAQAYTGNALGGVNFVAPNGTFTDTESGTVSCVLQFLTQPANTQTLTNITSVANDPTGTPVKVQALIGGSVATGFSGTITLAPSPAATITGNAVAATSGVASYGSSASPPQTALTLDGLGTFTLTASASGFTSATSNPFKLFAGVLNCSQPFPTNIIDPQNVAPDQPGYAFGNRNAWNKDGVTDGACVPVLYTFTNNILVSADPTLKNSVNLTWDTQSQINAAFQYTVNWQPVPVDSPTTGWSTAPRPQMAWLDTSGNLATGATPSANIAWIPGLACVSDTLPVPYGTLAANLGTTIDANNQSTITINNVPAVTYPDAQGNTYLIPAAGSPNIPPVPFPIVIADTVNAQQSTVTERMTAVAQGNATQNVDGSWNITYTVRRGTAKEGDPTGSNIANHAANYMVMSTPLPIIPNDATTFKPPYKVNTQSQMCIAKHGFTSFQIDANGNTQVMYTTTIFDIGDGWVQNR